METMLRLTEVCGLPVVDPAGARLGRIADLAVDYSERFSLVTGVVIARGRSLSTVPWSSVARVGGDRVVVVACAGIAPSAGDLHLARDLLDAQVVDIAGRRLARVGEIELALRGAELRAVAAALPAGPDWGAAARGSCPGGSASSSPTPSTSASPPTISPTSASTS